MNLQLTELSRTIPDLNMFSPFSLSTAAENIIQEVPEVNTSKVVHLNHSGWDGKISDASCACDPHQMRAVSAITRSHAHYGRDGAEGQT